MTKAPKDYSKGKIYVIRNHCNSMVYVGHTTQPLSKRFNKHKNSMNSKTNNQLIIQEMKKLGVENFYIELVENYPCTSEEELTAREGFYIREFDSYKNGYNMLINNRKYEEWYKENKDKVAQKNTEYWHKNKAELKDKRREYKHNYYLQNKEKFAQFRENNKDKLKEYLKNRYNQKKEDILKLQQEKTMCQCGVEIQKGNMSRHQKSKKHLEFINNI
jgi:group I intron endonuclease